MDETQDQVVKRSAPALYLKFISPELLALPEPKVLLIIKAKCKNLRPGFEKKLLIPFLTNITVTLNDHPHILYWFICNYT